MIPSFPAPSRHHITHHEEPGRCVLLGMQSFQAPKRYRFTLDVSLQAEAQPAISGQPAILFEKILRLKPHWQSSLLQEFSNMTNKERAV